VSERVGRGRRMEPHTWVRNCLKKAVVSHVW
jgi:hypothetical protein